MKIPFVNLKTQYNQYKTEIDESIHKILDSNTYILGEEVSKLEKKLSDYTGAEYCISCSSGTDALLISLMALEIQPGDEILTTPFTFFSTAEVIALRGAVPIFIDIDEKTYNIDVSKIEEKISEKTKAIMPVSLYGQPSDMDEINSIAKRYNIAVIEDAAQSFGAEYKGKKSCNLSEIGCTSFFPAKPLGCYGDGGAIFTTNGELAEKVRSMMNHGQGERYQHRYIGVNGRLDAIQAAVLNVKLKYYDEELVLRENIAAEYSKRLKSNKIIIPDIMDDRSSVFAQYSVRVRERDNIIEKLNKKKIPVAIHYPIPVYRQKAFDYLDNNPKEFPITELISQEIMSLPMSPFIEKDHQDYIIDSFNEVIDD
jgi:UDP-2-acetamido-2-deoxy-ribo-hexuluronate aminotransferase